MRREIRFVLSALVCLALLPAAATAARCGEVLTLRETVRRALALAPSLSLAAAQSELFSAQADAARAPLLPNLSGAAEYNNPSGYDPTISNNGLTMGQFVVNYVAFDGGRQAAQWRAARYAAQAATLGVRAARAQIVYDARAAYYGLLRAEQTQQQMRTSLERLNRYVATVKALRKSGRAIASDVLKIESARDSAKLALAAARQVRAHASIVLGSLIGEYGRLDLTAAEVSTLPPAPQGPIARSPVLLAAERQVSAARLRVNAARAERYPTFKIQLTGGYEGVYPRQTVRRFGGASYDGAVSLPIFEGGLISAHIDEARAGELAATARERQIKLQLSRDFADATMRYRNALEQIAIVRDSESTADGAFALDWTRFLGGGTVTLLEVLTSYQQAQSLRLALLSQQFAARQAAAQAALLLGRAQ